MIKNISQAVSVKKANLFYDDIKKEYFLIHYGTEIFRLDTNLQVLKALKCSPSSTRAIKQTVEFLGLNWEDIRLKMTRYTDFYKYPVGA